MSKKIPWNKGKKHSEETKRKISEARKKPYIKCKVKDCVNDKKGGGKGFCTLHYQRTINNIPLDKKRQGKRGFGHITDQGYHMVKINGKKHLTHHLVMEQYLGRELIKGENVHHKNGVRNDNRLENLELWVSHQPSGQRPEDLIKWAKEILICYDNQHLEDEYHGM